jgi:hypothetical protein
MAAEVEDESNWDDKLVDYDSSKSNSLDDETAAADSFEDGQHPQTPSTSPTHSRPQSPQTSLPSDTNLIIVPHEQGTRVDAERRHEEAASEGSSNVPSPQSRAVEPTLGQLADKEANVHHSEAAPPSATSSVDGPRIHALPSTTPSIVSACSVLEALFD